MFILFISSYLLLVCQLQSNHKRSVAVIRVFNFNDWTLFFLQSLPLLHC